MYDYKKAVREDILNAIEENAEYWAGWEKADAGEMAEIINDNLWTDDSVTGNGSGSYTFSAYEAEQNLVGNWDIVRDLVREYGIDGETVIEHIDDPEYWDVSIRCYLLSGIAWEIAEEIEEARESAACSVSD